MVTQSNDVNTEGEGQPTAQEWVRRARDAQRAIDALTAEAQHAELGHEHGMQAVLTVFEEKHDSVATVLVCDCFRTDRLDHINLMADILIQSLHEMKRQNGLPSEVEVIPPTKPEIDPLLLAAHELVAAYDAPDDGHPDWAPRLENTLQILREVLRDGR
jgi:hypothetical protein